MWLNIDQTSGSLDTVLELVDSNGNMLARDDNQVNDLGITGTTSGVVSNGATARPLVVNALTGGDYFSNNRLDAGMSVILPGTAGSTAIYYVRVRSNPVSTDMTGLLRTLCGSSHPQQPPTKSPPLKALAVRSRLRSGGVNLIIDRGPTCCRC